ncbi:GxxExxY protein [Ruminococcus sp. HUN007]|uniref:GxxExxY protein n=1 Tax=Ruminococcus sp. HUN007 TaxID=1514668 RepID=UPI000678FD67|nr:GxxExxY protein [Ruminococcus sp. HUN007]
MEKLLERYAVVFDDIYEGRAEAFDEEEGRRRFLLFVRPVINGTGNYYVEARTRNNERMDIVIDYHGERFVVELKIWRGVAYHEKGEKQLAAYLEHYHLDKGYLLTYSFNKKKKLWFDFQNS